MAKPFLKWVGGKRQLLPELLKRVPTSYGTYHEPFVGGGALFFALQPKHVLSVLSDANLELVTTYRAVQNNVERVIMLLRECAKRHSPEMFYNMRARDWQALNPPAVAARMIYLNKTCFNGLFRVNSKGQFNSPMGRFESPPTICDADNLRACSLALQGVRVEHGDFRSAFSYVEPGDFVYCDPPYVPVTNGSFTSYTSSGFGPDDQADLAAGVKVLTDRGAHVLLSNAGTNEVRKLYEGWTIEEVAARRNVNSNGAKRGEVVEYLISKGAA
jgi:DNA adenine methylase